MKKNIIVSRDLVPIPNGNILVEVGRTKSVNVALSILDPKNEDKKIVIATQKVSEVENPQLDDIYPIGTICEVINVERDNNYSTEVYKILIKPVKRVLITQLDTTGVVCVATYESIREEEPQDDSKIAEMFAKVFELAKDQIDISDMDILKDTVETTNKTGKLADIIADRITNKDSIKNKQIRVAVLQELNVVKRISLILKFFKSSKDSEKNPEHIKMDQTIDKKVNENLSKQQKEFYLREKMRAIKEEIGKINPNESDVSAFRKKVEDNPYPSYIKTKVLSEINKLESSPFSQENAVTRTYIEWLLNLPYWQETTDNIDIEAVRKVLDDTHYGLEKVKERIIEFLAVRARAPKGKSPIVCLVGPPGVGKTSLAISIAKAINKKFVKMSLGGTKDESEIRGHRRTYVGSLPGKIIKGMKQAEVINPLFLLDEIDKMASDYKGDPSSAMLEVLDPEQNNMFVDNYIDEPYDLSKVLFICTANYPDKIPEALYDRLEIIELSSYTEHEKVSIANNYLINKVLENSGLENKHITFTNEILLFIIRHYTREAGVRELERLLSKIARKLVVKLQKDSSIQLTLNEAQVKEYLGKIMYEYNKKDDKALAGVVNGMAYTSAGGDLLPIEVTHFKGKGTISITGNLKETMKESAQVALGYVKANREAFGIPSDLNFSEIDIHIHVPNGGVPKDGPSAGVTLTTAIISALTNRIVPNNISMTGEITLRGKVGIIGGVREKTISAYRGGVTEIFMPKDDERYIEDIPADILKNITIHFVEEYKEIYDILFSK